jgi:hypothetical protein
VADCPACGREDVDFAHGVWEALAATLAAPLWESFLEHVDMCPGCARLGIWHCPAGRTLAGLLPDGYLIAIGAAP